MMSNRRKLQVLSDISGDEDHFGHMDKVAPKMKLLPCKWYKINGITRDEAAQAKEDLHTE